MSEEKISYAAAAKAASFADVHVDLCIVHRDILAHCNCSTRAALRELARLLERAEKWRGIPAIDLEAELGAIVDAIAAGFDPERAAREGP